MRSYALLLVYKLLPKVSLLSQLMSLINPLHLVARHGILSHYRDVWLPQQHVKFFMSHSKRWNLPCISLFSVAGGGQLSAHAKTPLKGPIYRQSLDQGGITIPPEGVSGFCSTLEQEVLSLELPLDVLSYFTGINYAHFMHTILP